VDTRSPAVRSRIMRSVGTRNTGPELVVRSLLHRMGYRFRLHSKKLPGKPDLVFPSRQKIVLVHGCFWHGHACDKGRLPKSRLDYWSPKIAKNRLRDSVVSEKLRALGWQVEVVWQCETKQTKALESRLRRFLGPSKQSDRLS
jgi:DNA mismatch endonuclease (patch repair protein)